MSNPFWRWKIFLLLLGGLCGWDVHRLYCSFEDGFSKFASNNNQWIVNKAHAGLKSGNFQIRVKLFIVIMEIGQEC